MHPIFQANFKPTCYYVLRVLGDVWLVNNTGECCGWNLYHYAVLGYQRNCNYLLTAESVSFNMTSLIGGNIHVHVRVCVCVCPFMSTFLKLYYNCHYCSECYMYTHILPIVKPPNIKRFGTKYKR